MHDSSDSLHLYLKFLTLLFFPTLVIQKAIYHNFQENFSLSQFV